MAAISSLQMEMAHYNELSTFELLTGWGFIFLLALLIAKPSTFLALVHFFADAIAMTVIFFVHRFVRAFRFVRSLFGGSPIRKHKTDPYRGSRRD